MELWKCFGARVRGVRLLMARPATTWVPLRTGPADLLCTWFMLASYSSDLVCCNEPVWWFGGNCIQISHSGNWWACDEMTVTWDRSADTVTVILGQMNWSLGRILRVCMCVCVGCIFLFFRHWSLVGLMTTRLKWANHELVHMWIEKLLYLSITGLCWELNKGFFLLPCLLWGENAKDDHQLTLKRTTHGIWMMMMVQC